MMAVSTTLFISCSSGGDTTGKYDTKAIAQLDDLSEVIGQLTSCSYTLDTRDYVKFDSVAHNQHDVYLRGPNKLYIHTVGRRGANGFWYDGLNMALYSYDNNQYDTLIAKGDIMTTVDYVQSNYDVDFPGFGFFYSSLTDDVIAANNSILHLGSVQSDGIDYVELLISNDERTLHIWIEEATNLPYAIRVESKTDEKVLYEAAFSNWRLDPELPDMLFEFEPPIGSTRVKISSKN